HAQRQNIEAEKAKVEAKRNFETSIPQTVVGGRGESEPKATKKRPVTPVDTVKQELLDKVSDRTKKLRRSRHFLPLISAVAVGLLFLGVQYNRLLIAQVSAYVSPGSADSQNIILDPTTDTKVAEAPRLVIPKINVDVPVVYTLKSLDNNTVQDTLRFGVVHYPIPGADSVPGQVGNTVILGHSSNDVFDPGNYKFAFLLLDRLEKGDTFYLNYQSTRYTYTVTDKKIIEPTQVNTLVVATTKPLASLVTCTPAGTALHRLVISAEQVSPDPAKATQAPVQSTTGKPTDIPGNSPTLLERLFGG
ncbi:MAG TPA: sortase, partial [Candidatus Saccharimonadales bacterium]|nr:sortase [Candidatus Saccharimonadales bacterium]